MRERDALEHKSLPVLWYCVAIMRRRERCPSHKYTRAGKASCVASMSGCDASPFHISMLKRCRSAGCKSAFQFISYLLILKYALVQQNIRTERAWPFLRLRPSPIWIKTTSFMSSAIDSLRRKFRICVNYVPSSASQFCLLVRLVRPNRVGDGDRFSERTMVHVFQSELPLLSIIGARAGVRNDPQ